MKSTVFLVWAACATCEDVTDEVTLLQMSSRKKGPSKSIPPDMLAVAASANPQKSLAAMELFVKDVVASDSVVDDTTKAALTEIKTTLVETTEKVMLEAHAADEDERSRAFAAVQTCLSDYNAQKASDEGVGAEVRGKGSTHKTCREQLQAQIDSHNAKCEAMNNFLASLTPPSCTVPGRDGMSGYIAALSNYHLSLQSQWPVIESACSDAETARAAKLSECNLAQTSFETAFCSYRQDWITTCSEYRGCFNAADYELDTIKDSTSKNEAARKLEWTATQKIKCFIDVLLSDEETDARQAKMDACHSLQPDVSALTLSAIADQEPEVCDLTSVQDYPCTDGFVADNYGGLAEVQTCSACPELPSHLNINTGHASSGGVQSNAVSHGSLTYSSVRKPTGGPWSLALNVNTGDGNVVWFGNEAFWESETELGGATGDATVAFDKDYKDLEIYNNKAVSEILIVVHKDGEALGWRRWTAATAGEPLKTHFSKGMNCGNLAELQHQLGSSSPDADEGSLDLHEPLVKANRFSDKTKLFLNAMYGNDPNRVTCLTRDWSNSGAGLGSMYDVHLGNCGSNTMRPQADAMAFSDKHHWQRGLIGEDHLCNKGSDCPNPPCGQCPWTYPSGLDYDYAMFVA